MKKIYSLFWLALSVCSMHFQSKACGNGLYYEFWASGNHLFLQEMLSDTLYQRYFSFSNYSDENDNFNALPEAIVQEWREKFPQATRQDILNVLFSIKQGDIAQLKNGQNPSPGNSFWAAIIGAGAPYIDYIDLVYQENSAVLPSENEWATPIKDIPKLKNLLITVQSALESSKDAFLKQKYVYMLVKIQHCIGGYAEAIKSFDQYVDPNLKSLSYYRALGYKAGALRRTGDTLQAKILFVRIFDQCPPLRLTAFRNFKYLSVSPDKYMDQITSDAEKSAISMMQYVREGSMNFAAIELLYQSDPSSSRLELITLKEMNAIHINYLDKLRNPYSADTTLLLRNPKLDECTTTEVQIQIQPQSEKGWFARLWEAIINFFKRLFGKSESKSGPQQGQTADNSTQQNTLKLPFYFEDKWLDRYVELLEKINKEGKVKNKELFRTALGYCYLITGRFDQADPIFKELSTSKSAHIAKLNEYFALWSELVGHDKVSPEFENLFTAYHQKYHSSKEEAEQNRLFELQDELSRRYLVEQQYIKALLIHRESHASDMLRVYFTCSMLDSLSQYITTTPTSNLEKHFKAPTVSEVRDYKIRKLILMGRFAEALKIDDEYRFYANIKNSDDQEEITSLSTLVAWQQKGDAESLLMVADVIAQSNLWQYNVYPWGSWRGYHPNYGHIDDDHSYTPSASYPFNVAGLAENYLNRAYQESKRSNGVALAESYYLKAIALSKDDNFKAQAYFKAQALRIKSLDAKDWQSDYYGILKTQYHKTPYYKDMYNSCSFLRFGKVISYDTY